MTFSIYATKYGYLRGTDDITVPFLNAFAPPKDVQLKIFSQCTRSDIVKGKELLKDYVNWVLESNKVNDTEVYETGVGFSDGGGSLGFPHLTEKYNAGEEHVKQLNNWIEHYENQGYVVVVDVG